MHVIILGAGASFEAKLPVGDGLKDDISRLLAFERDMFGKVIGGDEIIETALRVVADARKIDINEMFVACEKIARNMPLSMSIDNFIDSHRSNNVVAVCGKLSIVRAILKAESKSLLYVNQDNIYNTIKFGSIGSTWYPKIFQIMHENREFSEFVDDISDFCFVIFNYDRCLEHFLHLAIRNYYDVGEKEAADACKRIEFLHPYGTVGDLEWQDGASKIGFGREIDGHRLADLSKNILTFTEGKNLPESDLLQIRRRVREATSLTFMGFAFHDLNMQLLFGEDHVHDLQPVKRVYGTFKGSSEDDRRVVSETLMQAIEIDGESFEIVDRTCTQLLSEYRRSLFR